MAENKRVITSQKMDEPTPPNIFPDFDWLRENRERLWEEYRDQDVKIILIYQGEVVGQGRTVDEAIDNAESRLAPDAGTITPIIFTVHGFNPLIRRLTSVRHSSLSDGN